MIEINLSERDFDYEIQALVNSFFPGRYFAYCKCKSFNEAYKC